MNDSIPKGEVVGGKYRVEEVLGVGAMGIVHAAHHLQLDERVALKVLRADMATDVEAVKRFAREAKAAAKIKNEHVARVFDVGVLPDNRPYIVMEYLEGEDLASWLAARGALPFDEAIEFILQACEALAEAHTLGIVHRDLKPSNLYCSRRPDGGLSIKLLDFGISKIARPSPSTLETGPISGKTTMGSPFYMSPEQMKSSHDVDHRADIWALGVILFELLTGTVPFYGATLPEVCINVATRSPRSVRNYRRDVPEEIDVTIARCLEKNPAERFDNLAEFAGSLFPFANRSSRISIERIIQIIRKAGRSVAPPRLSSPSEPSPGPTIRPVGATVRPPGVPAPIHHLTWVGLAGAAVVVLGVVLLWTKPTANVDTQENPAETPAAAAQITPPTGVPVEPSTPPRIESNTPAPRNPGSTGEDELDLDTMDDKPEVAAAPGVAPIASGVPALDPLGEIKSAARAAERLNAPGGTRKSSAAASSAGRALPGADLRREKVNQRPREIDENDPYAP